MYTSNEARRKHDNQRWTKRQKEINNTKTIIEKKKTKAYLNVNQTRNKPDKNYQKAIEKKLYKLQRKSTQTNKPNQKKKKKKKKGKKK